MRDFLRALRLRLRASLRQRGRRAKRAVFVSCLKARGFYLPRAMVAYPEMNVVTWKCGEVEETAIVLRAAAGEMQKDKWEAWVVRNVGKS